MRLIVLLAAASPLGFAGWQSADSCPSLSPTDRARLEQYVVKKYHVPDRVHLQLLDQRGVNSLCYRRLVFQGQGPVGKVELRLFASPDLRFLSSDILDSSIDPEREEAEDAKAMMGRLLEGEYAERGPHEAPLTLVVFSDFQCPFCRRMEQMINAEPLLSSGGGVRLVFRHMPLAQHDWAQRAAEAAACAQFQSQESFWRLHDSLFENQDRITSDGVMDRLNSLASKVPGLDVAQFRTCVERQMSLGAVIRDRDIGIKVGVNSTPTLFLNGRQLPGIKNGEELHRTLVDALDQAKKGPVQAASERKGSKDQVTPAR